ARDRARVRAPPAPGARHPEGGEHPPSGGERPRGRRDPERRRAGRARRRVPPGPTARRAADPVRPPPGERGFARGATQTLETGVVVPTLLRPFRSPEEPDTPACQPSTSSSARAAAG